MKKIFALLIIFILALPAAADSELSKMPGQSISLAEEMFNTQKAADGSIVFTDKTWFGAAATTQLLSENGIITSVKAAIDSKTDRKLFEENIKNYLGEADPYNQPTEAETNCRYYYKYGMLWTLYTDDNSAAIIITQAKFDDWELYQVPKDSILIQTAYGNVNDSKGLDRVLLIGKPAEEGYSKLYLFAADGETREILQGTFNYKLDGGKDPELQIMDINGDGIDDILVSSHINDSELAVHIGTFAGNEGYKYLIDPMDLFKGSSPVVRLTGNYTACVFVNQRMQSFSLEQYKESLTALKIYSDQGKLISISKAAISNINSIKSEKTESSPTAVITTSQNIYLFDKLTHICTVNTEYAWKRDAKGPIKTVTLSK